jgi:hypothetical protein
MGPGSRRGSVNPRALVGKILLFNGLIFGVLSLLLGVYTLFGWPGAFVTGLLALIFAGVGLLEGTAGLLVWLFPGGVSAPARVVNDFYAALERQDYTAAFECLDLSMSMFPGQTVTRAEFIKRAQTSDAERGVIVNYTLASVQANPSKRLYTIKVTRRSGAYRARLQLVGQGSHWKIVSFDRF